MEEKLKWRPALGRGKSRFSCYLDGYWRSFVFKFSWNKGAGYIGGWTFYIARNAGSWIHSQRFSGTKNPKFKMGFTKSSPKVPYMHH